MLTHPQPYHLTTLARMGCHGMLTFSFTPGTVALTFITQSVMLI